jgi:hypothetical protein
MRNLALSCLLAFLAACDHAGQTFAIRAEVDGVWQIDARARVGGGIAVFECLHSASNRCYYTLFAKGCAAADGSTTQCSGKVLEHFSLAVNSRRSLHGRSDFRMCVSHRPGQMRPDCSFEDDARPVARL